MQPDLTHRDVVKTANEAVRLHADDGMPREYLCECDDLACSRSVRLTAGEYDALRPGLDARVLHPLCVVRDERRALLAENRLLRARMRAHRELLRAGAERLRRPFGG